MEDLRLSLEIYLCSSDNPKTLEHRRLRGWMTNGKRQYLQQKIRSQALKV